MSQFSIEDQFRQHEDVYGNRFIMKKVASLETGESVWNISCIAKDIPEPRVLGSLIESSPQPVYTLYAKNLDQSMQSGTDLRMIFSCVIIDKFLPKDALIIRYCETVKIGIERKVLVKRAVHQKFKTIITESSSSWQRDVYKISSKYFEDITNQLTI